MGKRCLVWCLWTAAGLSLVLESGCGRLGEGRRIVAFETAGAEIKLLGFPIHNSSEDGEPAWTYRHNAALDLLADHGADVIGLQGADPVQVQDLQRGLAVYEAVGTGSADWDPTWPICPVLYRKDRFRAAQTGSFWFSNTPWAAGSVHWGQGSPRVCIWVRLTERLTGRTFIVYNMQMDRRSAWSREKSAELLLRQIARGKRDEPVVVFGDFVDSADSRLIRILQGAERTAGAEGTGLVDTWLPSALEGVVDGLSSRETDGAEMILVSPQVEILWAEVDRRMFEGRRPSGCFPAAALIRFP